MKCPDCGATKGDYIEPKSTTLPSGVMVLTVCTNCSECGCAAPKYTSRGAWDQPKLVNDCAGCACACHDPPARSGWEVRAANVLRWVGALLVALVGSGRVLVFVGGGTWWALRCATAR